MTELMSRLEPTLVGLLQQLVELNRQAKIALLILMDALLCVVSVWVAFSLRLGEWDLFSPAVATVISR